MKVDIRGTKIRKILRSEPERIRIGCIYRQERKRQGLSLPQLEDENISRSTMNNIERGVLVGEDKYVYYAKLLGIDEELFGIISKETKKEKELKKRLLKLEEIISANPENVLAKLEKINSIEKLENKPIAPLFYFLRGTCYSELKHKTKEAEQDFFHVVKLIEKNSEFAESNIYACCLNELGLIAYRRNDFEKALQYTINGLRVFHPNGERLHYKYILLLNKCIYLQKLGNTEKALRAIEELDEAIHSGNLEDVRTSVIIQKYTMYAEIYNDMNSPETALEYAKRGIKLAWINTEYNRLVTLWNIAGRLYYKMGNLQEAEDYFLLALDLKPKITRKYLLPPVYTNLGKLYLQKKKYIQAKQMIEDAIKLSSEYNDALSHTEALTAMGHYFLEQNLYEDAINLYKQAATVAHQHNFFNQELDAVHYLCTCYNQSKNKSEYIASLERMYFVREKIKERERRAI